ncbi:phosphatase PAP2 family protein [Glaciibacter superstes]|uniref:phosphatase PAP2 family protein n=1 Tax=Glaciibacter superstes TaxID=501023 RepID=UPI0003B3A012|nr:phosphatase PAP2 family protein [Glaciibacter superstes]
MRASTRASPIRYLAAALAAAVVLALLYVFFVRTQIGQTVDQLAYDGADFGWRSVTPFTRRLLDALPMISGVVGGLLTVVIAVVRRNWLTLLVALCAAVAAAATTQILKYVVFDRPDLGVEGFADSSFPSGHTTVAAASALAVFLVSSPRARPAVAGWGAAFTVLAGVSTLANQWHRPSDVIAALLVVAVWGCLVGAVLAVVRPVALTGRRTAGRGWLWWIVVPFLVVTAVAFVITYLGANSESPDTVIAYIGGATAIIAAGFLLALGAIRTFARLP